MSDTEAVTTNVGVTFEVDAVERSTVIRPTITYGDALTDLMKSRGTIEAYSRDSSELIAPRQDGLAHGFVNAINIAYANHYPVILSPDMIWLLITQGFAAHVRNSSEDLRSQFVRHSGTVEIIVIRDQFIRGFEGNDWEGVFTEFSDKVRQNTEAGSFDLVVRAFSTTGFVERAAFEVTLLDSMQHFFDYTLLTRCGIPEITLLGTPEDWEQVRDGALALERYGLGWWLDCLMPVIDEFVNASNGNPDREFWQNFYKLDGGSGGPYITGHAVNLFPYIMDSRNPGALERNPYLGAASMRPGHDSLTSACLTNGLSVAPFIWDYYRTKIPMEFVAGFVGVRQDPETLALRPEIGWAVVEKSTASVN